MPKHYRDRTTLINDFLTEVQRMPGRGITLVGQATGLGFGQIQAMIELTTKAGLIKTEKSWKGRTASVTPKGIDYMNTYANLRRMLVVQKAKA